MYFPPNVFENILSYCNKTSKEIHKEKQEDINEFFKDLTKYKKYTLESFEKEFGVEIDDDDLSNELFDWIIEEMVDCEKSQDISIWLMCN